MSTDPEPDAGAERRTLERRVGLLEEELAGVRARLAQLERHTRPAWVGKDALRRLATRANKLPRYRVMLGLIVVLVLAFSALAAHQARVPFELQAAGTHATLLVDGQTLTAVWPPGITHATPSSTLPQARLFQLSGTDYAGTTSADPATLSSSTYFQVDCWIRECDSYSQWGNFRLRDDVTGAVLLRDGGPTALSQIALPAQFTLQGDLQRPDVASSISFSGVGSAQITIDPNGRTVNLNGTSQYYPHDWVPYLGEVGWTLSRACLWAFALLVIILIIGAIAAQAPEEWLPASLRLLRGRRSLIYRSLPAVPYVAAGVMLIELAAVSTFTYQQLPRVFDAIAYYFQGAIFRSGHLSINTPPALGFFSGPFMVNYDGHWFSHYPPGAPLAIALGMLLNLPWLVEPVLGALGVLMMADLARRWYGWSTTLLVVLLLALSPFYLFLASSYMSHMISLFALLVFLQGVDRLATTGDWRWGVVASAGVGYAGLTRELAVILFAIPVVIHYGVRTAPALTGFIRTTPLPWSRAAKIAVGLAVPALCCGAFYLYYDWRLTGQALLTPRTLFDARDTWGFGVGKGWWNLHTPAAGLFIMDNQLTSLLTHLFGWPYYFTLSFFLIPLLTLRLRPHDLLLYGIAAVFLLGYAGLYYHGIAFGPRYLFDSLPAYVLLTARGVVESAAIAALLLGRITRAQVARAGGVVGAGVALVALCACNAGFYLPRQFPLYYDYLEHRANGGLGYDRLHPSWMHHAIVLQDDGSFYGDVLFPLNDPTLQGDILYAFVSGDHSVKDLLRYYPHRALYWISADNQELTFRPMHVGPPGSLLTLAPANPNESPPNYGALASGPDNDLFVADTTDGTIRHYDANGKLLGLFASGVTQGWSFDMHVWHGYLYWLNPVGGSMWREKLPGAFPTRLFNCRCGQNARFTLDARGGAIIADPNTRSLLRYTAEGRLVVASQPNPLSRPAAVAITDSGDVFSYDMGQHMLIDYDGSLRLRRVMPFGRQSNDSAVQLAATGSWLVISDPAHAQLLAYDTRTRALHDMAVTGDGTIVSPQVWGLSWDGHELAIAGWTPGTVQRVQTGSAPF